MIQKLKQTGYSWIKWSEKYLKTDMLYIAKGGFWLSFGQTLTTIISLLLTVFFANFLPKETYGTYKYILSIAGILNIFSLTGMNQAVMQAVASGNEGALKNSVKYQLRWNLLMLTAFWVLSAYYYANANIAFALSFFLLGIASPLVAAFNTYGAYLAGKREFRLNNIFAVTSILIYAVSMITVILLSTELVWLIAAYSFATLAANLIFYFATIKIFNPAPTNNVDFLKYGREITFIGFIGPVVSQIDSIILSHFWGPAQLAVYSLAMAVPNRATSFIKDWVDLIFPKLALKTPEEINRSFYVRILQGMAIGALFTIAYIAIAPIMFKYLLPKYLDSVFYSQILAISFIFAMPNRYISTIFVSQKMSQIIFINNIAQNIVRLILYVTLGIWGGILGLILAQPIFSFSSLLISMAAWRLKI